MAEVNIPRELVENHTTEEVLSYVVKNLRQAIREYETTEDVAVAGGRLSLNAMQLAAYLDALNKKLAPHGPVVA